MKQGSSQRSSNVTNNTSCAHPTVRDGRLKNLSKRATAIRERREVETRG